MRMVFVTTSVRRLCTFGAARVTTQYRDYPLLPLASGCRAIASSYGEVQAVQCQCSSLLVGVQQNLLARHVTVTLSVTHAVSDADTYT